MKFLNRILGITLPNSPKKPNDTQSTHPDPLRQAIGYINFILFPDGNVTVQTDWIEETEAFAGVYAQLLYQINSGNLKDGIIDVLLKHGSESVKSQNFIATILTSLQELQEAYKSMPIISPSQALKVNKE